MGLGELFILAVGLAMDAFAVAVCKGLSIRELKLRQALLVGLWFGVFQGLMPALGYLLGSAFSGLVQSVDHWVAFILLCIIGGNMIREGVKGDEEDCDPSLSFGVMLMLAVATSIDALAVGLSNIICLLQPSKIVIGGGLANEGEYLLDQLQKRIRRLIPGETPVVLSDGGKWGGAIGAALLASAHTGSVTAAYAEEHIHYF